MHITKYFRLLLLLLGSKIVSLTKLITRMRVICSCVDNTKIFFLEHFFPIIYMLVGLDNFTFIMGSPLPVSFGQSPEVSSLILISQTAPGRIRLPRVCFYMREHLITMSVHNNQIIITIIIFSPREDQTSESLLSLGNFHAGTSDHQHVGTKVWLPIVHESWVKRFLTG